MMTDATGYETGQVDFSRRASSLGKHGRSSRNGRRPRPQHAHSTPTARPQHAHSTPTACSQHAHGSARAGLWPMESTPCALTYSRCCMKVVISTIVERTSSGISRVRSRRKKGFMCRLACWKAASSCRPSLLAASASGLSCTQSPNTFQAVGEGIRAAYGLLVCTPGVLQATLYPR